MSFYIVCIGDKKMKTIKVGSTTYYVSDRQDLISIAHELAQKGYSVSQISSLLGISERSVKKMMEECW